MSIVEFASKILSNNPSDIYFFNRNSKLYIVSDLGFAQIEGIPYNTGKNAISSWEGEEYDKNPVFLENEKEYFQTLDYNPCHNECSFINLNNNYNKISKLSDENIRFVEYYDCEPYEELKIKEARLMNLNDYLKIVNDYEKNCIQKFSEYCNKFKEDNELNNVTNDSIKYHINEMQSFFFNTRLGKIIPCGVIFTRGLIISTPLKFYLTKNNIEWDEFSNLKGSFSYDFENNPFNIFYQTNSLNLKAMYDIELENFNSKIVSSIQRTINTVKENIGIIQPFLKSLNKINSDSLYYSKEEIIL